ncbi:MAG: cytochrome c, partial [Chloroflexi bacterium]|nr:cytochrome c [Chloroflexota bacterium]
LAAKDRTEPQGRAIYQASCARCHGLEREGAPNWQQQNPDLTYPPPPHDSTGHTWHHSDGVLYRIVRDGGKAYEGPGFKSAMPPFRDLLSPEETRAVIIYLKSLWGSKERAFQADASLKDPFPDE